MLLAQPKSVGSDETAHRKALGQASAGGVPQQSAEVPGRPFRQGQSNQFLKLLNAKINLLIALLHSYLKYLIMPIITVSSIGMPQKSSLFS